MKKRKFLDSNAFPITIGIIVVLLTIVNVVLKVKEIIDWNWFLVFYPIWGVIGLFVLLVITIIIAFHFTKEEIIQDNYWEDHF